jgi:hypothetical protein
LTFSEFINKWRESGGAERANKDSFLNDLCDVLGVDRPKPTTGDPQLDLFVFERDAQIAHEVGKVTIGKIDLYKEGHFILEAKQGSEAGSKKVGTAKRATPRWNIEMRDAFGQALGYAKTIDDPPPFIVTCDIGYCFDLYATFDGTWNYRPFPDALSSRMYLADIEKHADVLRAIFTNPHALDPSKQSAKITQDIASDVARLARSLEEEGHDPEKVAKFLMRCLFTMFAEDIDLLKGKPFAKALDRWIENPEVFVDEVETLWRTMNEGGSLPFIGKVLHFNGGLFADPTAIPLLKDELILLGLAAERNWAEVEPAIFGTLLERALHPKERHRLGAHYTPRSYVERLVFPTIEQPIRADWEIVQAQVRSIIAAGKADDDRKAMVAARKPVYEFYEKLRGLRVLDPACGSGNFLFVALDAFKRLENEVLDLLHDLGDDAVFITHGDPIAPDQFLGIEVKAWAKEIAELVLWIGYLQWQIRTRKWHTEVPEPVLREYHNIELRDAVLAWDDREELLDDDGRVVTRWDGETKKIHPATGEEIPDESARIPVYTYRNARKSEWPAASFVVGNPPYIGNYRMRSILGEGYAEALRETYGEVPASADYVMYWWHKAAQLTRAGAVRRFGLITTNSFSQAFARRVADMHLAADPPLSIVFAIPDHPWVDTSDGAAVRVAMTVGEEGKHEGELCTVVDEATTDNGEVAVTIEMQRGMISSNLTIGTNVASAVSLRANERLCSPGFKLHGEGFVVAHADVDRLRRARDSGIVRQYLNGKDLTQISRQSYVIDLFGTDLERTRSEFPEVYQWVAERVRPEREARRGRTSDADAYAEKWWLFGKPRPELRKALAGLSRFIVTPETAKHRFFVFLGSDIAPDNMLVCMALDDAFFLGVLSSNIHVTWALAAGGTLEDRPRYNKTVCFDPFPFPDASGDARGRVREIAERLDHHRKDRQAKHPELTLTGMYNVLEKLRAGETLTPKEKTVHERGLVTILHDIHEELDIAVSAAYGWPQRLTDDEILTRLVALNVQRAAEEADGLVRLLRPEFQATRMIDVSRQKELAIAPLPVAAEKEFPTQWPNQLADQLAVLRSVMYSVVERWTAKSLMREFRGAKRKQIEAALESLEALGLVVSIGEGDGKMWTALRPQPHQRRFFPLTF